MCVCVSCIQSEEMMVQFGCNFYTQANFSEYRNSKQFFLSFFTQTQKYCMMKIKTNCLSSFSCMWVFCTVSNKYFMIKVTELEKFTQHNITQSLPFFSAFREKITIGNVIDRTLANMHVFANFHRMACFAHCINTLLKMKKLPN